MLDFDRDHTDLIQLERDGSFFDVIIPKKGGAVGCQAMALCRRHRRDVEVAGYSTVFIPYSLHKLVCVACQHGLRACLDSLRR